MQTRILALQNSWGREMVGGETERQSPPQECHPLGIRWGLKMGVAEAPSYSRVLAWRDKMKKTDFSIS